MGREGSKREEGEWGRETGLGGAPLGDKRGKRLEQGGLKSYSQYNWGAVQPGMTERPIAPKDSPAGRPALFGEQTSGPDTQNTPPRPLWQTRTFPQARLSAGDGGGSTQLGPGISQLQSTPVHAQTSSIHT